MTSRSPNGHISSGIQQNGFSALPPRLKPSSAPSGRSRTRIITTNELFIAALYPITLVAAAIFYHLSPSDAAHISYFSGKRNIINVFFVKYGWLWTTAAFLLHLSRLQHSSRSKAAVRWGVATVWWILVTQWCFGPPIMDRTFIWTGGSCQRHDQLEALNNAGYDVEPAKLAVTSAACKMAGGKWTGGHDLSGHVFMLTHASLFLWSELLPSLKVYGWGGVHTVGVLTVLGIWWWMLLMTGVYFHTATEKITGWLAAMLPWGALYGYVLKTIPELRTLLGVPGI